MRLRTTYADRGTFDVRADGEILLFGPRTAIAVDSIRQVHNDIEADQEYATLELRERMTQLRLQHMSRHDAIALVKRSSPELWSRVYPWQRLEHTGVDAIRQAAETDTRAILNTLYEGKPAPFTPCRTPLKAWQRYGRKED